MLGRLQNALLSRSSTRHACRMLSQEDSLANLLCGRQLASEAAAAAPQGAAQLASGHASDQPAAYGIDATPGDDRQSSSSAANNDPQKRPYASGAVGEAAGDPLGMFRQSNTSMPYLEGQVRLNPNPRAYSAV